MRDTLGNKSLDTFFFSPALVCVYCSGVLHLGWVAMASRMIGSFLSKKRKEMLDVFEAGLI